MACREHADYPAPYTDAYLIDLSSQPRPCGRLRSTRSASASSRTPRRSTYSGSWLSNAASGSIAAAAPGSRWSRALVSSFTFAGTGVRWIGYRDEWSGMANVYVDGALEAVVDTFAQPSQQQQVLFCQDRTRHGPPHAGGRAGGSAQRASRADTGSGSMPSKSSRGLEEDDAAIHYSVPAAFDVVRRMASPLHSNGRARRWR